MAQNKKNMEKSFKRVKKYIKMAQIDYNTTCPPMTTPTREKPRQKQTHSMLYIKSLYLPEDRQFDMDNMFLPHQIQLLLPWKVLHLWKMYIHPHYSHNLPNLQNIFQSIFLYFLHHFLYVKNLLRIL